MSPHDWQPWESQRHEDALRYPDTLPGTEVDNFPEAASGGQGSDNHHGGVDDQWQ